MNESRGSIASANNPAVCGLEKVCTWIIHANQHFNLRLAFVTFDVPSCSGSYVEVRDGSSRKAHLIGRFCGDARPPNDICTSGDSLWIEYKYNSTRELRVNTFRLTYQEKKCGSQHGKQLFTDPGNSGEITIFFCITTSWNDICLFRM